MVDKIRIGVAIILFSVLCRAGTAFSENPAPEGPSAAESAAVLTDDEGRPYGQSRKYFHPFLSITESYSDNILGSHTDRLSDFSTVISPGIWLSLPVKRERPTLMQSSSMAPGGYLVEDLTRQSFRHFQSFLFYQADIQRFARRSSENNVTHRLEGRIEYLLRSGFSAFLQDQYMVSHDERGTGFTDKLTQFHSNLLDAAVSYDTRHKLLLRVGFSNFVVDYDQSESSFRRRTDNAFSAYVFYSLYPKTDLFAEYRFIDITYDSNRLLDGEEDNFFIGVRWDISSKTQGSLKAGYGTKGFRAYSGKNRSFIFESRIDTRISGKTSLFLNAWRKTNETNLKNSLFILANGARVGCTHKLTGKLSVFADLSYEYDQYRGDVVSGGHTDGQLDRFGTAGIGLRHKFKRWLTNEIGYSYSRRDSSSPEFDYSGNTLYFRISAEL